MIKNNRGERDFGYGIKSTSHIEIYFGYSKIKNKNQRNKLAENLLHFVMRLNLLFNKI